MCNNKQIYYFLRWNYASNTVFIILFVQNTNNLLKKSEKLWSREPIIIFYIWVHNYIYLTANWRESKFRLSYVALTYINTGQQNAKTDLGEIFTAKQKPNQIRVIISSCCFGIVAESRFPPTYCQKPLKAMWQVRNVYAGNWK